MKIIKCLMAILSILIVFNTGYAENKTLCKVNNLTEKRIIVIKHYLKLLGEGKYKELLPFFTPRAVLSDPIKGLTTPAVYYPGLYKYLTNPRVTVYDIYVGTKNPNVLAAHFTMKVKTKEGKIENRGQIVDLFVFAPNSTQFAKIYIQNNMTNYEFTTP